MRIFACPFCCVVLRIPEYVTEDEFFKGEANVNMECPVCKQWIKRVEFEKNTRIEVINKENYLKEIDIDYDNKE